MLAHVLTEQARGTSKEDAGSLLAQLDRTDLDTSQRTCKGLWREVRLDEIRELIRG